MNGETPRQGQQPATVPRPTLEELRRHALLPWADVAYPPFYFVVVGMLLWLRVLPLWAMALVMPPLFFTGVVFIVSQGVLPLSTAEIAARPVDASRCIVQQNIHS